VASFFWRNVRAPPELTVHIELLFSIAGQDLPDLFTSLTQHLCEPSYDSLSLREYEQEAIDWPHSGFDLWGPSQSLIKVDGLEDAVNPPGVCVGAAIDYIEYLDTAGLLNVLNPTLETTHIRHLDIAGVGYSGFQVPHAERLRGALLPFTAVETLIIGLKLVHVHVLEEGINKNNQDEVPLPSLRHLVITRSPRGWPLSNADVLKELWSNIHRVLKYRASLGVPIAVLTLDSRQEALPRYENELSALKEVDDDGLRLAAELVKVVDKRVWMSQTVSQSHRVNTRRALDIYRD